jgi:hypothetical protein
VDGAIVKGFPRIPVKKPSSILKIILERLGTSQAVEIVNDYASDRRTLGKGASAFAATFRGALD